MTSNINRLLAIIVQLRDPENGCPWDKKQNFQTIAPYTLEEAYEVVDAINRQNMPDLQDELGDLLLQVVFHAQMANELGHFDFNQVVDGLIDKLTRRHPHVFGDKTAKNADDVQKIWQETKDKEHKTSEPTPVNQMFSALMVAQKISGRAAKLGFDWQNPGQVVEKLHEEIAEYDVAVANNDSKNIEEEIGDLFFVLVNLARKHNLSAEMSMAKASQKFENRFKIMLEIIEKEGKITNNLTPEQWEEYWQMAKLKTLTHSHE